jgi:hypothetical protein
VNNSDCCHLFFTVSGLSYFPDLLGSNIHDQKHKSQDYSRKSDVQPLAKQDAELKDEKNTRHLVVRALGFTYGREKVLHEGRIRGSEKQPK